MYKYNAKVVSVYDGDTITAIIDLGFNVSTLAVIRLYGINTPEVRGLTRNSGLKVRDIVRSMLVDKEVVLNTYKDRQGKYGRFLATVYLEGSNINEWLVREGYAKLYNV